MAEAMGLRERKKFETGLRIWRTAVRLFTERGFDDVSVAEIAEQSDVSKMTVFNYFGSKEELLFAPIREHFADAARAIRERPPGESAVAAVKRQFVEAVEARDPSVGVTDDPYAYQVRRIIEETPALLARARLLALGGGDELVEALREGGGDELRARVAAGLLTAARNSLIAQIKEQMLAGVPVDEVAGEAVRAAGTAFAMVENGLGDYGARPGPEGTPRD
ncbi:TetR/AcrR family transcriptional regulator [Streptomyces polyrhachis]|uniref:TetR/AcrR family transcriptional regulator n=1 Tax=Streptomyces polyrhachis TaxID=1282885 RepID=A0ABW2GFU2_9ACTN